MLKPLLLLITAAIAGAQETPAISRILPPPGIPLPAAEHQALAAELEALTQSFAGLPKKRENANAEVLLKAVRFALELNEFQKPQEAGLARELLAEARSRITALRAGQTPWMSQKGLVVRGYYSPIDGSPQPFGLEIPNDAPATGAPAWVWLRGRADKSTDLHFLAERMKKKGQFAPPGCLVVHPFGRFCTGYKNAGEQDVLDVTSLMIREGRIHPGRIALAGFSMGGAGAWLLGAHYTDRWAVVHTGAGFVDVRRYQNLTPEKIAALPPWEVTLWGQNDVPDYRRNLLNVPLISYSGEKDKQRASAEIMAQELQREGLTLTHLIGSGMEHKYHPDTLKDIQTRVTAELLKDRPAYPLTLTWQSPTLDYNRLHWLHVTGLGQHWKDARVDARLDAAIPTASRATLTTANVTALRLQSPDQSPFPARLQITIDGQSLTTHSSSKAILLVKDGDRWHPGPTTEPSGLSKRPGLQGPIDDAFTAPFLYVLPDSPCASPAVDQWVRQEIAHQRDRWRWLMRGQVRQKKAGEITADDIKNYHLILWGDAAANSLIARTLPSLPVRWTPESVTIGSHSRPGASLVPLCVYPNPLNPSRYIVLNSGLTFREAHSKTNSLQNPKLPDWAILDITTPPTDTAPGKILTAGFFDESWKAR